jgi:hypothetical protein
MEISDKTSLVKTVDNINEAHFWGRSIPKAEREKSARWIAGRQGLPGEYGGLFAPTAKDYEQGMTVFTGEKIKSRTAGAHIMGEEADRALRLLKVSNRTVRDTLGRAEKKLIQLWGKDQGVHCCGFCTGSLWRNLTVGGFNNQKVRLAQGLKDLTRSRIGNSTWKRYPFYYTILALLEIDDQLAKAELQYAAPRMERLFKRLSGSGKYDKRRKAVLERGLNTC